MRFELERHHRDVPDTDLLADLARVAADLNNDRVTIDEYNERGTYHATTLTRRFGSWFTALEKAGLKRTRNLNIPEEELFQNLVDVWQALGRQPKYNDLTSQLSNYCSGTYEKRFGTWRKALEAFVDWADGGATPVASEPANKKKTQRTKRNVNHRLRFLVMRRDNFKCVITGRSPATDPSVNLEVDHIVPWDKGGETVMENLQTLAREINAGKSNLNMHEDG
ncbi:MAG: homing endonuclease associated repeat-containing protein [Opitutales bacterium]